MTLVEARRPDGHVVELTEVHLTASGLLIMVTDADGNRVSIHRYAWDGVVKAVNDLFAEEERQAREWIATHPADDD